MNNMEIPTELRNLDFETYDAISALVVPEKKGEIVSITALVEEEATKILAGKEPPSKTLLNKSLSDKINSLDHKFEISPSHTKEKTEVIEFLRTLLAIRNLASHTYGIGFAELTKLEQDYPGSRQLLLECPLNLWEAVKRYNSNLKIITK